jgi:outer membrane protein assembly factor BamA
MLPVRKYYLIFLLLVSSQLQAQFYDSGTIDSTSPDLSPPVRIADISISGNKKTKVHIILRELPFHSGDEFTEMVLGKKMLKAKERLVNMGLFHTVTVEASEVIPGEKNILITVRERWYVFPLPYLKHADREFNQWLFEKNASFDRVNYGVKVTHNNATGLNDKFRLWLVTGYTRQVSFGYDRLYIDKNLKWGINARFSYGQNRELSYNTIGDKQAFLKDERFIRNHLNTTIGFSYRPAIRTRHYFGVTFTRERISDTVMALNPDYFRNGRQEVGFPTFYYTVDYFNLDYNPYPTRGYAARISLSKSGVNHNTNLWQLHVKNTGYLNLSPKAFIELNGYGGIKLPFRQPYFSQRFLGYDDAFLQGYEYYVIDGAAGGYVKTTFAHELFDFSVRVPGKKKRVIERVPFKFYGKIYGNAGYVYNPNPGENELSNKVLFSGGVGIDIVTIYDVVVKLEWSFNHLGQNGLFLHRKTIF